ncbi:MAG: GIY-YIG nuclease family protein [Phycisphaeraceae bacterium]
MKWGHGPLWIYSLQNHASRFYIGHTDDLERRLTQHNDA